MLTRFDRVANSYHSSLTPLPEAYIHLIQMRFGLTKNARVLDLGCGSGLLTFALARFSSQVHGVDSSRELIGIAREIDRQKRIRWTHSPVEKFDFGQNRYKLIISFEAFHLFPNPDKLIMKCALALVAGGHLCVGWANYQWEIPFKEIIVDVFAFHGISWGERANLSGVDLASLVKSSEASLSAVVQETIAVEASSHVRQVATYLASIEKAAQLEADARAQLAQELEDRFKRALSSEWVGGIAQYSLAYCRKDPVPNADKGSQC